MSTSHIDQFSHRKEIETQVAGNADILANMLQHKVHREHEHDPRRPRHGRDAANRSPSPSPGSRLGRCPYIRPHLEQTEDDMPTGSCNDALAPGVVAQYDMLPWYYVGGIFGGLIGAAAIQILGGELLPLVISLITYFLLGVLLKLTLSSSLGQWLQ